MSAFWSDESVPGDRLIEAGHLEWEDSLPRDQEMTVAGEPSGPQLHFTMHHMIANQVLASESPEAWQIFRRLATLGYDWHKLVHIVVAIGDDICRAMNQDLHGSRRFLWGRPVLYRP